MRISGLLYDAGRELGAVSQSLRMSVEDIFACFCEGQKRLYADIAAIAETDVIGHHKDGKCEDESHLTDQSYCSRDLTSMYAIVMITLALDLRHTDCVPHSLHSYL